MLIRFGGKMTNRYDVSISDRIIAGLTYITSGWVGFIYAIILFFMKKKLSPFLRYNIMQAILIAFTYYVLCLVFGLIFGLLSHIPIVQILVSWIQLLFNRPMILQYSLIQAIVLGLFIYMAIVSFCGKYPRVPFFSKIIEHGF